MKFSLVIALIVSAATASDTLKPFNDPTHFYSHEEVMERFAPILEESVKPEFQKWTAVFFSKDFGESPHGTKGLAACWTCFYNHMVRAAKTNDPHTNQLKEIYSRLRNGHQKRIQALFPDLYTELLSLSKDDNNNSC
jgi:hypothetical protein